MNFLQVPDNGQRGPGLHRWARLRVNALVSLRRGAWYPVLSVGVEEVVVEVHGASTILARDLVEIVYERPQMWSVVPPEWGGPYLVCPECAERVHQAAITDRFSCPNCGTSFAVALEQNIA